MITARDMAFSAASPMHAPVVSQVATAPLAERILLVVLFVTVLASSMAFIEPSPHDALMGVLAVACLAAGVRFARPLATPFLLLLVWNVAGMASLLNAVGQDNTILYTGTSVYLAIAAMLFACLFAENTMPRLAAMRAAYIATAVLTAATGIAGYFHAFPGAFELFEQNNRAMGTFKDPNVFGPFLIWPALYVMSRIISTGVRVRDVVILGVLLFGLLLSFSRGAWINVAVATAITITFMILTAPSPRIRMRIYAACLIGLIALSAFVVLLLSLDSVMQMFAIRAQALQSYDVGDGGRFRLQELALGALLKFPMGMGPFEFSRMYGQQQHNVYLQAFIVYGWAGGMAYILLVATTMLTALRSIFVATPWRPYLITAFAAFVGNVVEGAVIDTDHWRVFFLLLGINWGLLAATVKFKSQRTI